MKSRKILFTFLSAILCFSAAASQELTIFSIYDAARLEAVFKPFTERTGIKINIVFDSSNNLINRLELEGEKTTADLHLDKDLVYHTLAASKGLYQPFQSKFIQDNILPQLIDSNNLWYTIVYRARIIVYNKNFVNPSELSTYEDLANSKWINRLCLRTSNNSYNEALGSFLIHHLGLEKTKEVFTGLVGNLAMAPIKGDTDAIKAVAEEKCDVAIANSYYLAPLVKADSNYPVKAFFPNQNTTGSHLNGVGIGLVKHTKNIQNATLLMEYLASKEVQAPLAQAFSQYPSNPNAQIAPVLLDFGKFNADKIKIDQYGKNIEAARKLFKEINYN